MIRTAHGFRKGVIIALIIILTSLSLPVFAEDNGAIEPPKMFSPPALGHVVLKDHVYAEINNVNLAASDNGQMATFTLTVHNESSSDLNFIDYWTKLRSKGGSEFSVSLIDPTIDRVPANSTKDIVYYSKVGKSLTINELIIRVIKWDFSTSSFQRVLGDVEVPARYINVTPAEQQRNVRMDNSDLIFQIQRANIGKSEKYYRPDIKLAIKNNGNKSVTLPNYQISIITNEGLIYPLNVNGLKDTALSPLMSKEFQLSGTIPLEIKEGYWKLLVSIPVKDSEAHIPIAVFELPKAMLSDAKDDLDKDYTFADSNGVYNIRLNGMHRYPFDDEDIISANLTLSNKGTNALPVPKLSGTFLLDDAVKRVGTVVATDKIISLLPGASLDIQIMCRVPYTFELTNIKLTVQESDSSSGGTSEDSLFDLVQFSFNGEFTPLPVIGEAKLFEIKDIGYRSAVQMRKTMTYGGKTADIFAVEVTIENREKRLSSIQNLSGYFTNSEGIVYPATISKMEDKVNPGGKALIHAWTMIPGKTKTSDLKLVLGKVAGADPGSGSKAGDDGAAVTKNAPYVDPVSFVLPAERKEQDQLKNLDFYPYELSISYVKNQIYYESGELRVQFEYNLEKDLMVKTEKDDIKLVIEIVDGDNQFAFSKEYDLGQEGKTGEGERDTSIFKLGSHELNVSWNDASFAFKIHTLKKFTFNIYQQFQPGQKKLIASKQMAWSDISN